MLRSSSSRSSSVGKLHSWLYPKWRVLMLGSSHVTWGNLVKQLVSSHKVLSSVSCRSSFGSLYIGYYQDRGCLAEQGCIRPEEAPRKSWSPRLEAGASAGFAVLAAGCSGGCRSGRVWPVHRRQKLWLEGDVTAGYSGLEYDQGASPSSRLLRNVDISRRAQRRQHLAQHFPSSRSTFMVSSETK